MSTAYAMSGRSFKRTDVHAPVNLNPEDYRFQFCYTTKCLSGPTEFPPVYDPAYLKAQTLIKGSLSACHHCGATTFYNAVMLHVPTGEYIAIGETCLGHRFGLTKREFTAMRKQTAELRKVGRIKFAMTQWVESQSPEVQAIFGRDVDLEAILPHDGTLWQVRDIRDKGWNRYGSVSDKARDFAMTLVQRAKDREAKKAQDATEHPPVPAPDGAQTITGTILGIRFVESEFGTTTKLLLAIDSPEGRWKAWVTRPSNIDGIDYVAKGDVLTLTATFEPSSDDPSFAFAKRPRKASGVKGEVQP